ncbi:hypothetical protein EJ08DRAFT_644449 [Tothia fuscella]|uniref:Chloramphenicol phosphotransferase n=1 Tax=Tothia fuscella TaxID=1048955 RepID=A0A9P4P5B9_9PEZI|nr:hypothetical protein EJ08DRAFT_644449 [Tothia fuscella]
MKPCTIILNGYPGVGKYTIAKHMRAILDSLSILFYNHEIIDPVTAIHPGRTPKHYELRKEYRKKRFDEIIADPTPDLTIFLTVCQGQSEADIAVGIDHLRIARERGIPVFWVNLICSDEDHKGRIGSEERRGGGTSKVTDVVIVEKMKIVSENALMERKNISEGVLDELVGFEFCVVDTTKRGVEESAGVILEWIRQF